jgi:hypothetical protein
VDDILMLEAQDAADHVAALYEQAWQAEDRVAGLLCWDAKRQAVMKMICEKVVHGLASTQAHLNQMMGSRTLMVRR